MEPIRDVQIGRIQNIIGGEVDPIGPGRPGSQFPLVGTEPHHFDLGSRDRPGRRHDVRDAEIGQRRLDDLDRVRGNLDVRAVAVSVTFEELIRDIRTHHEMSEAGLQERKLHHFGIVDARARLDGSRPYELAEQEIVPGNSIVTQIDAIHPDVAREPTLQACQETVTVSPPGTVVGRNTSRPRSRSG